MLLKQKILDAIAGGRVSLVFRRWRSASIKAGGTMKVAIGVLSIDAVDIVALDDITQDDAIRAGHVSRDALIGSLGDGDLPIHRVRLSLAGSDTADDGTLGEDERRALRRRLDRHDRASGGAPWTRACLGLIGTRPDTSAGLLAQEAGWDKEEFKRRVRKLRDMGLVDGEAAGYRLSPRGQAFMAEEITAPVAPPDASEEPQ